ncbi:MAG: beta-ketoacyl-[acyl-carrier-protein] synthase family protein [Bryobacteraceae bacterium]
MTHRVAVTGIGAISAFGQTYPDLWAGIAAGRSAIRPLTLVPPGVLRFPNAAEVPDFDPLRHFEEKEAQMLDRFAQFAAVAAREAVKTSGIEFSPELAERTAIVLGCSGGGKSTEDDGFHHLYGLKEPRVSPLTIARAMSNAGASRVSLEYGITGPVFTISSACSSANHALGQAFRMVRSGEVEVAIAGGSEAPLSMGFLKAWEAMRVVAPDTCRPFSSDRRGLILGEGAAVLILEPVERARARGATVLGEIAGFGMSSDAHHITQPSALGAARAIKAALADAQLEPDDIGYVNAHGTGTLSNDATETEAIRNVFGEHAQKLLVSSTKSMHGHALGAAGALEAAATLGALQRGLIPPTANFIAADPACDLDVVPNTPRPAQVEFAISNSFAFGGLNAVLVFRKSA